MSPVAVNTLEMGGLEFPVAINEIDIFKQNNNVSVNVLAIESGGEGGGREEECLSNRREKEKLYILRKSKFNGQVTESRRTADLFLIDQEDKRHYAMIKNLSGLLASSNSEHQH